MIALKLIHTTNLILCLKRSFSIGVHYIVFCKDLSVETEVSELVECVIKGFRISYSERVSDIRSRNASVFNAFGFSILCPSDGALCGFEYKDGR